MMGAVGDLTRADTKEAGAASTDLYDAVRFLFFYFTPHASVRGTAPLTRTDRARTDATCEWRGRLRHVDWDAPPTATLHDLSHAGEAPAGHAALDHGGYLGQSVGATPGTWLGGASVSRMNMCGPGAFPASRGRTRGPCAQPDGTYMRLRCRQPACSPPPQNALGSVPSFFWDLGTIGKPRRRCRSTRTEARG